MSLFSRAPKPVRLLLAFAGVMVGLVGAAMAFSEEPGLPFVGLTMVWLSGLFAGHGATIEDLEAGHE